VPYRRKKLTFAISSPDEFLLNINKRLSARATVPDRRSDDKGQEITSARSLGLDRRFYSPDGDT